MRSRLLGFNIKWAVLVLILGVGENVFSQSNPSDSVVELNGIEGKFEMLTDGIFPNDDPHLGKGLLPLSGYYSWKRKVSANQGLDYVFILSPIFQLNKQNGSQTSNLENDLMGRWRLIENDKSNGNISFWFLHTYNFSSLTTSQFSKEAGLSLETNLGDVPYQNYFAIMGLWWEQTFIQDKLLFRIGHINSNMVWGNNKYINDDRDGFMNSVSSSQQGTSWVSNRSLGFQVSYIQSKFYVAGGFQDANTDQRYPDFSNFFKGSITSHAELGITPDLSFGSGKYSVTVSSVQNLGEAYNYSLLLNIRQDIVANKVGLFARYGKQSAATSMALQAALTAGVYVNNVFNFSSDAVRIAYLYSKATNSNFGTDKGVEGFYRFLITQRLDVSLDAMFFFESSNSSVPDNGLITSLRLRFIL